MARIGFITTSYPRWPGDPAGSFVRDMAQALERAGHTVEVVVPAHSDHPCARERSHIAGSPSVFESRVRAGARAREVFYGSGVPDNLSARPDLVFAVPKAVSGLAWTVGARASGWDAVISHWLLPSAILGNLAAARGIPHLTVAHSADVHLLGRMPAGRALARRILGGTGRVGFVAETLREEFLRLAAGSAEQAARWRHRTDLAPMGYRSRDLECHRSRDSIRRALDLAGFTVLFLGRLVPIKGVDLLIEAVSRLPGLRLIVAGDGPERAALEERARRCGERIRFVGAINRERRAELLRGVDAVALPSRVMPDGRHEGLPLVLVEASACGVPVVATRAGGVAELVRHEETGLLVAPGDPDGLSAALRRLSEEPALCREMGRQAPASVASREWDRLARDYEGILFG